MINKQPKSSDCLLSPAFFLISHFYLLALLTICGTMFYLYYETHQFHTFLDWSWSEYNVSLFVLCQLPRGSGQWRSSCYGCCWSTFSAAVSWAWTFCSLCCKGISLLFTSNGPIKFPNIFSLTNNLNCLILGKVLWLWTLNSILLLKTGFWAKIIVCLLISGIWTLDTEALYYCLLSLCCFFTNVSIVCLWEFWFNLMHIKEITRVGLVKCLIL